MEGAALSPAARNRAARERTVVVAGYYGFGNLGDEILREVLVDALFRSGAARPVVLVRTPRREGEVARFDPLGVLRALRRARGLVLGGGGLLQNRTSERSLLYYLGLLFLARLVVRPVLLVGQGVGPIRGRGARALVRIALRRVAYLGCRDEESASLLRSLGMNPVVDGDLALLLPPVEPPSREPGPTRIALVLKGSRSDSKRRTLIDEVSALLVTFRRRGEVEVDLVVFFPQEDLPLAEGIARRVHGATLCLPADANEATRVLSQSDLVLASRLHAAELALRAGTPVAILAEDPKIEAFARTVREAGGPEIPCSSRVDAGALAALLEAPPPAARLQETYLRLHARTARAFEDFLARLDAALGGDDA